MTIADRVTERSLRAARDRAEAEVAAFIDAGLQLLRERGAAGLTVGGVLARAGRSTRAFYRHFASKDELLLAIYEHESDASVSDLRERVTASDTPTAALAAWIDATLRLAYDPRRARRTRVLAAEASRLQATHPDELAAIARAQLDPLVAALARGRDDGTFPEAQPERDAQTVHAIVWALVEAALYGGEPALSLEEARAHALRFCLPALGVTS